MAYLRLLLLPFSILYGLAIWIRNRCYDFGWFRSRSFDKPIIVVGNLAVGGTGKSPLTEYLIRLLAGSYRMATLSRGYGRETRGFLEVDSRDTASQCGDEPLQFKRKFPQITVAVDEDRVDGVERLIQGGHDVIVLDDAFQHRALQPGLAILLFDYKAMGQPTWVLPAGNYRDCFQERRRADIMIVTKTPDTAGEDEKTHIRRMLRTERPIPVLFSKIGYGTLMPILPDMGGQVAVLEPDCAILLVTGIANPEPLRRYLATQVKEVVPLRYADHHHYTPVDIQRIASRFAAIRHPHKFIVTTEKDAQRVLAPALTDLVVGLPWYVVPIQVLFDDEDETRFRQRVLKYCADNLHIS